MLEMLKFFKARRILTVNVFIVHLLEFFFFYGYYCYGCGVELPILVELEILLKL